MSLKSVRLILFVCAREYSRVWTQLQSQFQIFYFTYITILAISSDLYTAYERNTCGWHLVTFLTSLVQKSIYRQYTFAKKLSFSCYILWCGYGKPSYPGWTRGTSVVVDTSTKGQVDQHLANYTTFCGVGQIHLAHVSKSPLTGHSHFVLSCVHFFLQNNEKWIIGTVETTLWQQK